MEIENEYRDKTEIENEHNGNLHLIKKFGLKPGIILKRKDGEVKLHLITIRHIHSKYGWIIFEESYNIPQTSEKILEIYEVDIERNILKNLQ